MKIVFDPKNITKNLYVKIISDSFFNLGVKVYSLSETYRNLRLFLNVSVFHINWFENIPEKSNAGATLFFFKQVFKLAVLKLFRKEIVWTMHNKMPHDVKFKRLNKFLLNFIIRAADAIIIHSKVSREYLHENYKLDSKKIHYIPHPNYIDCYGPLLNTPINIPNHQIKFLFVGAVKPYKNIELLINIFKKISEKEVLLKIIGLPYTPNYGDELIALAESAPHIKLELDFIESSDLNRHLADSDILIFPYDLESSLNSGSVILAFSYGRTVVSPEIGTIKDVVNNQAVYSYTYKDKSSHETALESVISQVIFDVKKEGKGILYKYGKILFEEVKANNDKAIVGASLLEVYDSLTLNKSSI